MVIWYISSRFGIFYQDKSGSPVPEKKRMLARATEVSFFATAIKLLIASNKI
jgi:hypothetical protein